MVSAREVRTVRHRKSVNSIAVSPSGKLVATGGSDKVARVTDIGTGTEVSSFTRSGLLNRVDSVAFAPSGDMLAVGRDDGTACVYDLASKRLTHVLRHRSPPVTRTWPAPRWFDAAGQAVRDLHLRVGQVCFDPHGGRVASASLDGTARIWDARTGAELLRIKHPDAPVVYVHRVQFGPDGRSLATADFSGAHVWDATSGAKLLELRSDRLIGAVSFAPDGHALATVAGSVVTVWELPSGEKTREMTSSAPLNALAFSRDGGWLLTGDRDGVAQLWDAADGRPVTQMLHDEAVQEVAFGPGRTLVATASGDLGRVWTVSR
jgi:WD40 repeat protein